MTNPSLTSRAVDELLAGAHEELELGATAARILEIADEHPEARDHILAFAADWFAAEGSDLSDDEASGGRTAREHSALLDRFWQAKATEAGKPFDGLSVEKLDDVAGRCRIDRDVLRQLVRGKVDAGTVPGRLVGWLGQELNAPPAAVWAALSAADAGTHADYFAPGGRKRGDKFSFADAVRKSDLDPDDKRFWLEQSDV